MPSKDKIDAAIPILSEAWQGLEVTVRHTRKVGFEGSYPAIVIQVVSRDEIDFVHGMENFEGVYCPDCGSEIDFDWWGEAMDKSSAGKFRNLTIEVPCCGRTTNLNELRYEFPAGFARFSLSVHSPNIQGFSSGILDRIAVALGCKIRQVWEHL